MFPLLVLAFSRFGAGVTATTSIIAFTVGALVAPNVGLWRAQTTLSYVGLFTAGMFSASLPHRRGRWPVAIAAAITLAALWIEVARAIPPALMRLPIQELAAGLAAAAWLHAWSNPAALGVRILSISPLPAIGAFAYSLYLTHAPILHLIWMFFIGSGRIDGLAGLVVSVVTAVPLCIAFAWGFYLVAERPFASSRQRCTAATEVGRALASA